MESIELKNNAENLIYQTEKQLKEFQDKLKKEDYENINSKVTSLKDCKDSNDTDKIKSAIDDLNGEWSKVSQDLYNASQQAPDNAADVKEESKSKKTTTNKNDNVENVDYEVVDDEKNK